MVKVRLQGTTCEIKRMKRCIERNKRIKVISVSDAFPNKGTKKYFRQYMDVMIDKDENPHHIFVKDILRIEHSE